MIRSLFSGVSSMKSHQVRMDVVGNNIANVNTSGYKAGRANFQDTLYQTIKSGGKSTNPAQAGLGINVASINTFMKPGALQSTGRNLDLAINGSGFFKVTDGVKDYYTRDGVFYLDQEGYLVNSSGLRLVGELTSTATAEGSETFARVTEAETGNPTETLSLKGTLTDGTAGSNYDFTIETAKVADINAGENYTIDQDADNTFLNAIGAGFANNDVVEVIFINKYTNENARFEFTITDAATQTVADFKTELENAATTAGISGEVEMYYTQGGNEVTANTLDGSGDEGFAFRTADYGPGVSLTITIKDSTGQVKQVFNGTNSDFTSGVASESGTGDDIDSIINKINEKKEITGVEARKGKNNNLVLTTLDRTEKATMSIDGAAATHLGLPKSGAFTAERPVQTMEMRIKNDSLPVGSITILPDGSIIGTDTGGYDLKWEDGSTTAGDADIARISLYNFNNPNGLKRVNRNLFQVSTASGDAAKGTPGTPGYGTIESGYIEMSNVDLTEEFTNMITTQRGYQASARIITVSDTMLEELINLKR